MFQQILYIQMQVCCMKINLFVYGDLCNRALHLRDSSEEGLMRKFTQRVFVLAGSGGASAFLRATFLFTIFLDIRQLK